jgi:hypothetical protein
MTQLHTVSHEEEMHRGCIVQGRNLKMDTGFWSEGKSPLGIPSHTCKDNIKMASARKVVRCGMYSSC